MASGGLLWSSQPTPHSVRVVKTGHLALQDARAEHRQRARNKPYDKSRPRCPVGVVKIRQVRRRECNLSKNSACHSDHVKRGCVRVLESHRLIQPAIASDKVLSDLLDYFFGLEQAESQHYSRKDSKVVCIAQ